VTHRKRWARGNQLIFGPALGLAAALAAAACSSAPTQTPGTSAPNRPAAPAITTAQARQVFDHYVATAAKAASPHSASPVLSLVAGVEQAVLTAALGSHSVVINGTSSNARGTFSGSYSSTLSIKPDFDVYTYGSPTFYLPESAGYPRFFVASVKRTLQGTKRADSTTAGVGGAQVPLDGPALMLFSQSSAGAPWLLASVSQLPVGVTLPKLATDSAGYTPTVPLADAALLASPDDTGPLQAAVVDDGPASAAAKAVADGPLTTGMYQGAVDHVYGMTAPRGDVYQWELEGSSLPRSALRTADGGALVFYAMSLNVTVAVPDVINKADPVHSGPPIQVPAYLLPFLPQGRPAPLVQLSSDQLLSFVAIDPPAGNAKIQVIAIGGGLTAAAAS